jgi:hypothetical protein
MSFPLIFAALSILTTAASTHPHPLDPLSPVELTAVRAAVLASPLVPARPLNFHYVGLDEPDVTMSMDLSFFGVTFPIGVSLTPGASELEELVLTPSSLQVAGVDVTSDELKRQFGILSNTVLRDWTVCIAQYIPAGITLTSVTVQGF